MIIIRAFSIMVGLKMPNLVAISNQLVCYDICNYLLNLK